MCEAIQSGRLCVSLACSRCSCSATKPPVATRWKATKRADTPQCKIAHFRKLTTGSYARGAEAMQAKVLTEDEARRIAVNIARLPARAAGTTCSLRKRNYIRIS